MPEGEGVRPCVGPAKIEGVGVRARKPHGRRRGIVPVGLNGQARETDHGPGLETVKFTYIGICYRTLSHVAPDESGQD